MRTHLGVELWGKQRAIVRSVRDNKRTAARSSHGIGKSFSAASIALWWLNAHKNALVGTTAPTFRQVEKVLWQEVGKAAANAPAPLAGSLLQTEIKVAPGWYAFGFSSDNPTALQGLHSEHLLLIYDEASGIPAESWEALEGALTSDHCRLLALGNPTDPVSEFAREFKTPGTEKFVISAFDTPNFIAFGITLEDVITGKWKAKVAGRPMPMPWLITPEWVADKVTRWGVESPAFRSRVLAEFPVAGEQVVIPLHLIEAAQLRWHEYKPSAKPKVNRISMDVARYGRNETVIGHRDDNRFRVHEGLRGKSIPEGAGHAVRAHVTLGTREIVVDGDGLGGGTCDILREQKRPVVEFRGGGSPANDEDERFLNARAEMYWELREAFLRGEPVIDPSDDELAGQLAGIRYKITSKGKIQIESKDEMEKRNLPSPDRADSMAMAWAPMNKHVQSFINAMTNARA
jgi:phage terminase large subunit